MAVSQPGAAGRSPVFTVVTPSFNMLAFLPRCRRSVADQSADVEHIVVDGGSSDGSAPWLRERSDLSAVIEPDQGMYDAVNKGLRRARGRFVGYLNCDEQYLPGTLGAVELFFDSHPRIDIVFGNALLIRPDGSLLAYRKGYQPRWPYIVASHLYVLSCTMFFRRRVIDDGHFFDIRWRDVGDAEFVVRLLRNGYRAAHLRRYLAAFTVTGSNMSAGANAQREGERALSLAPRWVRRLRLPLHVARLAEKALAGAYRQSFPLRYAVYPSADASCRTEYCAGTSSFRWPAVASSS